MCSRSILTVAVRADNPSPAGYREAKQAAEQGCRQVRQAIEPRPEAKFSRPYVVGRASRKAMSGRCLVVRLGCMISHALCRRE